MKSVAVVYHSGFGHTKVLADAVCAGVEEIGLTCAIRTVQQATNEMNSLAQHDALIFGSPTYMGSVSADFKQFMDNTSAVWLKQEWKNKIAAGFTNSGSMSGDKFNTLIQLFTFAMQHSMIWIGFDQADASPENNKGAPDAVNRIGSYIGVMAQSSNEAPSITPPAGDIESAHLLGKRVATYLLT